MTKLEFLDRNGDFVLHGADETAQLYFPLANEGGMMSSVTPTLGGDCKTGQNTWLLAPCSNETLHESRAERNFWLTFADAAPWSVTGESAAQRADRAAAHSESCDVCGGLLWHTLVREAPARGLRAAVTSFVPAGQDTVELMRVTITNTGRAACSFTPTAVVPLYGRSADNIRDHRHVTSLLQRLTVVENGVRLTPTLTFDERGHRPGKDVYTVLGLDGQGGAPVRFLGTVQDFTGFGGSYDTPQALYAPGRTVWMRPGDTAEGYEMAAVLQFADVVLAAGHSVSYYLALGINCTGENYLRASVFEAALAETKRWWQQAAAATFDGADTDEAAWLRWVAAQPQLRRICGCSFLPHHDYGRGGRGWRDLWQDSLALLLHDPAATRDDLKSYFAGVRADGTNATIIGRQPGEFLADRNNIVRVWMDHGFWPLLTTTLYIEQSGDLDFLLEEQPYFCDNRKHRGEVLTAPAATTVLMQGDVPALGTILEHLILQNATAYLDAGAHGSIRLRGADWNDALDMAAQNGESVAFTAAYAGNLATLADLCRRLHAAGHTTLLLAPAAVEMLLTGSKAMTVDARIAARKAYEDICEQRSARQALPALAAADALQAMADTLKALLRKNEFVTDGADQSWMNSYYDNEGARVEGVHGARVRMMLTGQVFSILSGVADDAQAEGIARAADWYLNSPLRGGYCLNTNFGDDIPPLGRQFGFAYGHKENGAVFCHMSVMYAYALYSRGLPESGRKVLQELYDQCADFARARVYPGIPEYFDPRGRGMYPYLTGAASWLMLTMLTQVYGVRGEGGDLRLAPQLLADEFAADGTAAVRCRFAGHDVTVTYRNPQHLEPAQYAPAEAVLHGVRYPAENGLLVIPRAAITDECTIEVTLAQR